MEDSDIVDLYWEREEQAIAETASKYGHYCHTIAYSILGNDEDAEFIVCPALDDFHYPQASLYHCSQSHCVIE